MNIGNTILTLRKAKGMTQEQLAAAIGVSIPAVSKWETGKTLPDITMLAPIARTLGTHMNYLLSYQKDLTEDEVDVLLKDVKTECENNGFHMGMLLAFSLLKEYPNSDYLKLKIATSPIMLSYTIEKDTSEAEYAELVSKTTKLLEELIGSECHEISIAARIGLATRYMSNQRLDEAEQLLDQMPKVEYSAKRILPTVYTLKGAYEKALQTAQQNLIMDIQNVRTDIMTMYTAMVKQRAYEKALIFAENYDHVTKLYGNHFLSGADLFVDVYLKMNDLANALKWFRIYVEDIMNLDMDYSKSTFFAEISNEIVVASNDIEDNIKTGLYKAILLNPHYEVLRDKKEYLESMEKLKKLVYMI